MPTFDVTYRCWVPAPLKTERVEAPSAQEAWDMIFRCEDKRLCQLTSVIPAPDQDDPE